MHIKVTPLPHYSETHVGLPRWTFEEASTRDLLGANVNIRINVKSSNLFVSSKRITYHKKGVLLIAAKLLGRPVRIPTHPPNMQQPDAADPKGGRQSACRGVALPTGRPAPGRPDGLIRYK